MTLGEQDQTSKLVFSFERRNNKSIIKGSYENFTFLKVGSLHCYYVTRLLFGLKTILLSLSPGCHGYRREPTTSVFIFTSLLALH